MATIAVATMSAGVALAQTVEPTAVRITQPLMSGWQFVQDDLLSEDIVVSGGGQGWRRIYLPHSWNAQDAASLQARGYKRGIGWYRAEFPTPGSGTRHWLEFGAASLVADVWLNGKKLGQHKGAFTAFRFDVTDVLVPSGMNRLFVKVDNSAARSDRDLTAIPPSGGDFNVAGGLYRHVALISTPQPVHFALDDLGGPGVYASTTDIGPGSAVVAVRAKIASASGQPAGDYRVRLSLLDLDGRPVATADAPVTTRPGASAEISQTLNVSNPRLWQGTSDPYLYRLAAELLQKDGTPIDRVAQPFGIRQMRFDPDNGFFLNGRHVRLNGVGMHQDLLGKAWAITPADIDNSLAKIREMGANAVRFAHYPYGDYAHRRADELGLVVWAEATLGDRTTVERCSRTDPAPEFAASAKQQLRELIRQQYNHASIAMWAIGNESTMGQLNCVDAYDNVRPLLRELHTTAKEEDPNRPTVYAEYPHPVERSGPFATENITDLFATNRYFLWYTPELEQLEPILEATHAKTPRQPLAISEYGAGSALTHHTDNPLGGYPEVTSSPRGQVSYQPEEYASYAHEKVYGVLARKPYLWGTFVWNMFDFGSDYRNEGDVLGVNTKGLVGFDHQTRKDAFFFYKANWSSEPVTYITGRRYTDRAYPRADVKVYSNADEVELSVNGTPVAKMSAAQCPQRACVFKNIKLTFGENVVTATGNHAGTSVTDRVRWSLNTRDINISAGRLATGLTTSDGARFGSDHFFSGGQYGPAVGEASALDVFLTGQGQGLEATGDVLLLEHYRRGTFSYDIPVDTGSYDVTLGFLEPAAETGVGGRVFDVVANGQLVLDGFDILRESAGSRTPVTKTFPMNVTGERLTLDFKPSKGEAVVSYIRIREQSP